MFFYKTIHSFFVSLRGWKTNLQKKQINIDAKLGLHDLSGRWAWLCKIWGGLIVPAAFNPVPFPQINGSAST